MTLRIRMLIFAITLIAVWAGSSGLRYLRAEEKPLNDIILDVSDKNAGRRLAGIKSALKSGVADAALIEALCGALKDTGSDVRRAAAQALEKLEPQVPTATRETHSAPVVSALIDALADKDSATRAAILSALGVIAPPRKSALPALLGALKDPNPQLRATAIEALRRHGAAAQEALPGLVELALNEKHPDVVYALAASLFENDSVPVELAPFYVNALKGSAALRLKAIAAIDKIGAKAIPAMLPALRSDLVIIRRAAASFFDKHAKDAKEALPELTAALADNDVYVRKSAASAVVTLGAEALPALPELIKLLDNADVVVRSGVAGVVENLGPSGKAAVPALQRLLQDKTLAARTAAGRALAKMGAAGVDGLIELLKSPRDEVRAAVALALPLCGEAAIPGLAEVLKSESVEELGAALLALERMGGARDPAIAPLIPLLRHKLPAIRALAILVLVKCGARAVPALLNSLKNEPQASPELRAAIIDALGRAGKGAVPSLLEMVRTLRHDDPMFTEAIEALGKVGPSASDATPMLMELLTSVPAPPQGQIPAAVIKHVAVTTTAAPPAVPLYVKIDVAVLQALNGFGPNAGAALPLVFELLKDGDNTVRNEAARTIGKIASGTERLPPLSEMIERCDPGSIALMLRVFQTAGMEAMLIELDTPSVSLRQRISTAFANMPAATTYPFLIGALKNESPRIRSGVAATLADMRRTFHKKNAQPQAAAPLPCLDELLAALKVATKDSEPDVRVLAAYAYQKAIDPEDGETVGSIAAGLAHCSAEYRLRGMSALDFYDLEKVGRKAVAALPVLVRSTNLDTGAAPSASALLQRIGITPADVPVLIDAFKDKSLSTRKTALKLIENLGPDAKEAAPVLIECMADDDRTLKGLEPTLLAIGPGAAPALIEALKSSVTKIRMGASQTLQRINLDGEWLGKIAELLSDDRPEVRIAALTVLSASVEHAHYALPHVRELLVDGDKGAFHASLELLAVLGTDAAPALIDALQSTNPATRARAAVALKPRGGASPVSEAFAPLLALLKDDTAEVKAAALQTLSACNQNAAEIVSGLATAMKDESPLLRRSALLYLKQHAAAAPQAALDSLKLALQDPTLKLRLLAIDVLKDLGPAAGPLLFEAIGDPEHRVRAEAAMALAALGLTQEADKKILIAEMFALDAVEQYTQAQEEYFIKSWDENRVHFYAGKLTDLLVLPKDISAADAAAEAPVPYNGFVFNMLEGQGATAPGGLKKYRVDGKMSQGHALAAYPMDYGNSGRFSFMVGDDGIIYKKDLGPDTQRICAEMREFSPDDTWTKFKTKPKDEGPVRYHPAEPEGGDMEF